MDRQGRTAHRHRLPSILMTIGLLVICGGFASNRLIGTKAPGKLVPRQDFLTWQSPAEKPFRLMSLDEAQATFEVENVGGTPVRVLELKTSCGCAKPEIGPTPIAPGEVRPIEIRAQPLAVGERMASITLLTDSPETPEIVLRLRIVGSRRPPFMSRAAGDLFFEGSPQSMETREIIAFNVELASTAPRPPVAKSDIPSLKISDPILSEEHPTTTPDAVTRKYVFKVHLTTEIPPGGLAGEISVVDPWDADHVERIRLRGERKPPIRVAPARLVLDWRKSNGRKPVASILVLANPPAADLVVELVPDEKAPLMLGDLQMDDERRQGTFAISFGAENPRPGIYHVRIGRSSSPDRISVMVAVQDREASL